MRRHTYLLNGLIGATGLLLAGAHFIPGSDYALPIISAAPVVVSDTAPSTPAGEESAGSVASNTKAALGALAASVRPLSHPKALEAAFRGYFAYLSAHPETVKKPYLYFVDYGLPSNKPRGYVFDMKTLEVIDGPFAVAHGRGSSKSLVGVPTHFSNVPNSAATSLGLYLAQETYQFHGKAGGQPYRSIGLRLQGLSGAYNDKARVRRVVAHGAPYVTDTSAGRSEGCPAMEQSRAKRLLPKLAEGGLAFLFAPNKQWMSQDPWLVAAGQ